jgi:SM-20-related protein
MILNKEILPDLLNDLAQKGWTATQALFSQADCQALAQQCQNLFESGEMTKASIGRGATKTIQNEIRGDNIYWLDNHPVLPSLDILRQHLNEFFYLGLKRLEIHFAFYPPGAGYDKHVDNHQGLNHRKITFVLYLNENWQKSDGGELALFSPEDDNKLLEKIEPTMGTLILFRSDLFPHEVQKSNSNRLSLTGWFRDDTL